MRMMRPPVNGSIENFRRLKIRGNEYASVESLLRALRSDGVSQIAALTSSQWS